VLRGVIVFELQKLRRNYPELTAWKSDTSRGRLDELLQRPGIDPSTFPTGYPGEGHPVTPPDPSGNPSGNPSLNPFPISPTPTPTPNSYKHTPAPSAGSAPQAERVCVDGDGFVYPQTL